MLSEAAQALQTQEEKYQGRLENNQARLEHEKERRLSVEREMEMMRLELKELRESQREEERRISDESRLLYAEAFGSINLGPAKSDSEVHKIGSLDTSNNQLEKQLFELTDLLEEKNKIIG